MGLGYIRNWLRKDDGVTAVEFSFVAIPFVFLIIGIIEMALMFSTQSLLESSVSTASRLIRTGQIQQADADDQEEMFRNALCEFASTLIDCDDLQFFVTPMDDFGAAQGADPASFDEDGNLEDQGFAAGGVSDVVLIRVAYRYPIVTPLFRPILSNDSESFRRMVSTLVLQTEPYEFEE